ncbi:MAG TPA: TonB-dependent receptor [Prolixibacteraceae bacterium]|nr:TonB-dependent receptor [Prolixibacteraceae bacterium]
MRITFFFLVLSIAQVLATNSYSQNTRLSLSLKNVTAKTVLSQIEDQSQFFFIYDATVVDVERKVSVESTNELITTILDELFEGTNVIYKVSNRQVALTVESAFPPIQQPKSVTGQVTDASGLPLPGVTIVIKGTTFGTVADFDGKFKLTNVPEDAILVFTFVGMKSQDFALEGKTNITVAMVDEALGIDEVIVIGYGTQKKANLTGAVSTVNAKELEARPVTNVAQALQGMVPGLNITRSGDLGGSLESRPAMNIRGLATIGDGSSGSPLILIDGMEGDINAINPNDIENISVLKDAAASSIYGSRAPFGVILVTTKKGTSGKMQITYNGSYRMNTPIMMPKQMDSYAFVNYLNAARVNGQETPFFDAEKVQRVLDYQQGLLGNKTIVEKGDRWGDGYEWGNDNVDWFDAVYRSSSPSQEHSISMSGGNEKMSYYLSGNNLSQDGLMKLNQDTYKRYTLLAKINATLSKWATLSYTARFSREDYVRPTALTKDLYNNMSRQAWPTLPLYDPNGFLFSSPSPALALRDGGQDRGQTDWNYQQLNLTLEPLAGWKIFANLNYKIGDVFRHWDVLPTYNHNVAGNPYYAYQQWYFSNDPNPNVHEQAERTNFFSPNIYSEYAKSFGKHNVKVMVGFQSEQNKFRNLGVTRVGVMVPEYPIIDITSGTAFDGKIVAPAINGKYEDWSTFGTFSRINYDYDGRYLIEANLRYDGTSRFREDKRWNYFPSVSMGWNIAREKFWKPIENTVNLLKFRGSYGELGNQNTNNLYPTYQTMGFEAAKGTWLINDLNTSRSWAPGLVSSILGWERVRTWNVGADLGFFKNRLTSSFDYYVRYTNDMVGDAPALPAILGADVPKTNNTDLTTRGFELSIAWQDRLKNGLGYNVNFILSDSRTEITRYPNNPTGKIDKYYNNQMYGEIWGYSTIGIAKTKEEMDAHLAGLTEGGQTALGNNWTAGDIMYQDINNDGKIDNGSNTLNDHGDLKVIGNSSPRYLFGLDLSADWKGFDFRAFFQGILKRDYYQGSNMFFGASGGSLWDIVAFKQHEDYFRPEPTAEELADPKFVANPLGVNLDAYYPRPLFSNKNTQTQTGYLQNASYIRLKNLQLGYSIPQRFTRKVLIQKCRIYVSGENIWTGTKLSSIFDPETIDGGNGGNTYPLSKVYSVGVTVTL